MSGHVVSARRRGLSDAELDALEDPATWDATFDDRTHAVLRLADSLSGDATSIADGLVAELRGHFTEPELAELILVCGQASLNNRVGNAAKLLLGPPAGG